MDGGEQQTATDYDLPVSGEVLTNGLSHRVHQLHEAETQGYSHGLVIMYHSVKISFKALGDGSLVGVQYHSWNEINMSNLYVSKQNEFIS